GGAPGRGCVSRLGARSQGVRLSVGTTELIFRVVAVMHERQLAINSIGDSFFAPISRRASTAERSAGSPIVGPTSPERLYPGERRRPRAAFSLRRLSDVLAADVVSAFLC